MASNQEIEGPWNSATIKVVREPDDKIRVLEFFCSNYIQEEPTLKLLGSTEELKNDLELMVRKMLDEELTLIAEEDGEIAAAWISYNNTDIGVANSAEGKLYLQILDDAEKAVDFGQVFGTSDYCTMFGVLVAPKFRRQGLATELAKRSLALFLQNGKTHTVIKCTSPFTRSMMVRLGFEEIGKMGYDQVVNEAGEKIFCEDDLDPRLHYVTVYGKMEVVPLKP